MTFGYFLLAILIGVVIAYTAAIVLYVLSKDKRNEKSLVDCTGCKNLVYDSGGGAHCSKDISLEAMQTFNELNIRPCKEEK